LLKAAGMGGMRLNFKIRNYFLGGFDLVLSIGAVVTGILMIQSEQGIFSEYPKEWLSKLPFNGWVLPGILAILIFGLGNMAASFVSLCRQAGGAWILSIIMGMVLIIGMIAQVIILDEWYLATVQLMGAGLLQIALGIYVMNGIKQTDKNL
jgi:NADH:ubiquinone oxidoreductase subunit 6 (subunit J)